ncbi:MAG: DinB family protein [Chloroflexi bacterium]|nr:DinB family protein [Chloroflexota bacterium]
MLDFTTLRNKTTTLSQLTESLTADDLRDLTNEMIDRMVDLITDSDDAAVTFQPADPNAYDAYATDSADVHLSWTLAHVIVHVTASAEESAFLAAEMARGVVRDGRSRYEIPWQTITTIAQCRARLEESRRMRLACLDVWPEPAHLDLTPPGPGVRPINAIARFVLGLYHDANHLEQIAEIVRQAAAVRAA